MSALTTSPALSGASPRGPVRKSASLRRVLLIYTGGTIGMKPTEKGLAPAPGFLTTLVANMPMFHDTEAEHLIPLEFLGGLDRETNLGKAMITPLNEYDERIVFRFLDYDPLLDSSNVGAPEWDIIAKDVFRYYNDYDAFVILHGTDTLSFTASALSFYLENLGKTVVLTGSQIPLCKPRNDGLMNLLGAINIAGHFDIPEVVLYFASKLLRGCRSSKVDANNLAAFDSPNMRPLATVGISYLVNWALVRPSPYEELTLRNFFCDDISILRIFPGPFNTIRESMSGLKGLVLQTFGAGNAPERPDFLQALKEATNRGVVIVNVTQCQKGEVEAHYAVGTALLNAGVTPAGDMTPEAALVKLGWLLGSGVSPEEVRRSFKADLRGEVSTHEETTKSFALENQDFAKAVYTVLTQQNRENAYMSGGSNALDKINSALLPTLICQFASSGNLPELNALFTNPRGIISPNVSDYDGRSGLHLAAASNQIPVLEFFLKIGADVNCKDNFGRTPLYDAIETKHMDTIEMLISNGAEIKLPSAQIAGQVCLAIQQNDICLLQAWIEGRADINAADYDQRTPLHLAAACGNMDAVQLLISAGADRGAKDRFGGTPFDDAIREGFDHISKVLEVPKF